MGVSETFSKKVITQFDLSTEGPRTRDSRVALV